MKIKNLEIFSIPKAKTRLCALALTGTLMVTSLTGCGVSKKDILLEGSVLAGTIVVTIDGDVSIVRPVNSKRNGDEDDTLLHKHYYDIINGRMFTDSEECANNYTLKCGEIVEIGNILSYLTKEEMTKANDEGLSDKDIISIIYRIQQSQQEKKALLEGSLLAGTIVVTIDGDVSIVRPINSKRNGDKGDALLHKHYYDIVNGQTLTDSKECTNDCTLKCGEIVEIGSILSYLTKEEMIKANDGGLSDKDIISIIYRIKQSQQEDTLTKSR